MNYLYAAVAVACVAFGGLLTHLWDGSRYSHLQLEYANYKASAASQRAIDQVAATAAIQDQLAKFQKISQENDNVIADLHKKLAQSESQRASDRATASRMFHDAAQASCRDSVPKGTDQSGSAKPSGAVSLDQLANACSDLAIEDERNADKLDALIKQVKGNL